MNDDMQIAKGDRDSSFDVAKAIGIICVVLGHCSIPQALSEFIYIFHLPLFFIISGYFFKPNQPFKVFFLKKIKSILIPYISCAALIILYRFLLQVVFNIKYGTAFYFPEITEMVSKFAEQKRYTALWFFTALFVGECIFWLLNKIIPNLYVKSIICLVLGIAFIRYDTEVGKSLFWNADTGFIALIFLCFGNILKEKNVFNTYFHSNKRKILFSLLFSAVSILIFAFNRYFELPTLEMFHSSYGIYPLTVASALLMSMAILLICQLIKKQALLSFIGKNTVVVFTLHQAIFISIANIFFIPHIENMSNKSLHLPTVISIQMVTVAIFSLLAGYTAHVLHIDFIFGKSRKKIPSKNTQISISKKEK